MIDLAAEKILCLDFEASCAEPGSYPIEVGIADPLTGETRSWLIRPTDEWNTRGLWTEEAAAIHHIPKERLFREGLPVAQVTAELNEACAGYRVVTDSTRYDGYWLDVLYQAAGLQPAFMLEDLQKYLWSLACRAGRRPDIACLRADAEAQTRFRHTHRAAEDARLNAERVRLVAGYP